MMPNTLAISGFRLADDEDRLRDSPLYQSIREEINRRSSPLSGSTDWERVHKLCEQLASGEGTDLLIAIYYTVAALKVRGIAGLADALELQVAVLSRPGGASLAPARRSELYRWLQGRIGTDVRNLRPGHSQLRELFRCERALQQIDRCLALLQPEARPELEALGFAIFEQVDRLETGRTISAAAPSHHSVTEVRHSRRPAIALAFTAGLVIAATGLALWPRLMPSSLTDRLLPAVVVPQIISPHESKVLLAEFDRHQLESSQDTLLAQYRAYVQQLITEPARLSSSVEPLADSLRQLYPDDPSVAAFYTDARNWSRQLQTQLDHLTRRFTTARTLAANLNRQIEAGNLEAAQSLAEDMEDYAISLSPFIARIGYIETLISQEQWSQAKAELTTLDNQIKALVIKKAALAVQLESQG